MGRIVFVALFATVLLGCTSSAKVMTNNAGVYASSLNKPVGDMNLILDGAVRSPAGYLVVPKTTDLDAVVVTRPLLRTSSYEVEGDNVEEEQRE